MKTKGIDISIWQGSVDFEKVKRDCVKFLILREGFRQNTDAKFFDYVRDAQKAGIPILGVYHFSYALTEDQARDEAKFCIENVELAGLGKDTIIFYDFEYDTVEQASAYGVTLDKEECVSFTKAFCETVESMGYRAGIYTNVDYYARMYDPDLIKKYVFWLAHYTAGDPAVPCEIQQYTGSGMVDGIVGHVDMDYCYMTPDHGSDDRNRLINIARSYIGYNVVDGSYTGIIDTYNSHLPLARGYKVLYSDAWCATFVSTCAIRAGLTDIIPTECGCEQQIDLFQDLGEWVEDDAYIPNAGDVIYYDWDDSGYGDDMGWSDHVGIVESCDGSQITVIEGNYNGSVGRRIIPIDAKYIRGFGVPNYSQSAVSVTTNPLSISDLAHEVIQGKWGNDPERRQRLIDAGYDADAVQNRVNELLLVTC